MLKEKQLSSVWLKAAIVGSLWGSFEIVAGSFIHNLALPLLAGTILSFIGVLIAIAFQSRWRTPGLLWRAGLICALLKSISPSAVILTPMIGITLEGFLLEAGVLLFGNNLTGFIAGGGLAVISVLIFKVVRLLLVYGQGIVDAYNTVYKLAITQLGLSNGNSWWPILAIAAIYFIIGAIATIMGVLAGKRLSQRVLDLPESLNNTTTKIPETLDGNMARAFLAPAVHLVFLIVALSIQSNVTILFSSSLSILYILICLIRYPKVKAIISRFGFWLPIIVLSFIIPLISFQNISDFKWLLNGIKILSRASTVIVAFAAIGTELSSNSIRSFFVNGRFETIYQATSLAFTTLPGYIEHLKGMKFDAKQPKRFISRFVNEAVHKQHQSSGTQYPIIVVTADRGSGKTTFIKEIATILEEKKIPYAGFYAEGTWDSKKVRTTFTLTLLPSKESTLLCDTTTSSWPLHGRFRFNPDAISKGTDAIINAPIRTIVIIDEIGIMELNGAVWATALAEILEKNQNPIIISVRKHFLGDVQSKWNLKDAIIYDATTDCPEDAVKRVISC